MKKVLLATLLVTALVSFSVIPIQAADHGDPPVFLNDPDFPSPPGSPWNIADFFAFRNPKHPTQMVFVLDIVGPTQDPNVNPFVDCEFTINVDNQSQVDANGNVVDPAGIEARIQITAKWDDQGDPIRVEGSPITALFTGLRDDPFIFSDVNGLNVNALVIQVPLDELLDGGDTLLLWAQAGASGFSGKFQDSAGKPLTFALLPPGTDIDEFNQTEPKDHVDKFGNFPLLPDVLVYRPALADEFPNGRTLTDDVVSFDPATTNDVPFLTDFPFLAEPHS